MGPTVSRLDDSEKAVLQAYTDARGLMSLLVAKKIDTAAYKKAIESLDKSVGAVKELGTKNANDTWAKITTPAFEAFFKGARDAEAKLSDKGLAPDVFLQLVNTFTAVIEAKHRALSRALIAKGQTMEPPAGGGRPIPNVHPELPKELPTEPPKEVPSDKH